MFSDILESVRPLLNMFNPEEVFSSVTSFLGSGYVGIIVMAAVGIGAMQKLMKLFFIAICVSVIWLLCSTGAASAIVEWAQSIL